MSVEQRLPDSASRCRRRPMPIGNYVPWRIGGGLLFLSGVGPQQVDGGFAPAR